MKVTLIILVERAPVLEYVSLERWSLIDSLMVSLSLVVVYKGQVVAAATGPCGTWLADLSDAAG